MSENEVHMNVCLIRNDYGAGVTLIYSLNSVRFWFVGLLQYLALTPLDFGLWGWMNSEVCSRKVDKPDELLARILDDARCWPHKET